MNQRYALPSERWDRQQRRVLGWSLLASVALHGILFVAWTEHSSGRVGGPAPPRVVVAPAFGEGALQAVALASPRSLEVPPPPVVTEVTDQPVVELPELSGSFSVTLGAPESAGGQASGSGSSPGRGLGGPGSRTSSPVPRSLVPEWDPPGEVRGMRITARVRVNAEGEPIGEVELVPPTPDPSFNRRLAEKVMQMRYIPARRDGEPVEAWAEITFVF
ncbi:MAG: hypothetical protein JSV95_10110 [Gemmatimonadota bacterium]|nr:MAG: hypothetical protein JSV95_10110 [Gemmatimonadota bacterium]